MRLIQKNLKHKGYVILQVHDSTPYLEIMPIFTKDYLLEAENLRYSLECELNISVTLDSVYISDTTEPLRQLKEFKEKYHALPQNYTEEIRTGFQNGAGLNQTLPRYIYR